uniref:ATP-dependent DNA helicase 2 subunit 1 n=1 Tax=Nyssomyia neivai TaxID=330878 RepID=A0A1L8DX21_9DIPT
MFMQADENDEGEVSQMTYGGREGILFAIDVQKTMLDENENKAANFRLALQAIEATMKNIVISNQKDLVGIVLFNTVHSPNSYNEVVFADLVIPSNMSVLLFMDIPSVANITFLQSFHTSDDLLDFANRYGSNCDAKFDEVIWLCMRMFQKSGYKLQSSTIVMFTDNPLPHPPDSPEYQQAFVKARDLHQLDVEFSVIPMHEPFDLNLFYRDFISSAMNTDMEIFELDSPARDIESLSNRIYKRSYRKRCNMRLKMNLGDNLKLSVGVYSSVRHVRYPKPLKVFRKTNEIIIRKGVQEIYNETDGSVQPLLPHKQKKSQEFGAKNIVLTIQEIAMMKTLLPASIHLLGFKPRTCVKICNYFKHGSFLYPDETEISGSTKIFRALWKRCLERKKVAICVLTLRHKSTPRYVALVPQDNYFQENYQIDYNGFLIIQLPNMDDIRDFNSLKPQVTAVNNEQVQIFEQIIYKLKFRYHPKQFNDPALRSIYSNIEAFAFHTDGENVEDETEPDTDFQDNKILDIVEAIVEKFGELVIINPKRKNTETGDNSRKTPKLTRPVMNKEEILEVFRSKQQNKLTVNVLREYLQQIGVSGISNARKSSLIDKIKEYHNL